MTDLELTIVSGTFLGALAILAFAGLAAWRGWLELRRAQLGAPVPTPSVDETEQPAVLIELASVKERLRRLEAIANGVEL